MVLAARPAGFGEDEGDGEAVQPGDVFRAVRGADAAAALVEGPVDDVVAAVFYRPVPAVVLEQALERGGGKHSEPGRLVMP